MPQTKEETKEYNRLYYNEKREKILEQKKIYHLKNQKVILEKKKLYHHENKEDINEKNKLYQQTPEGIKSMRISKWRCSGVFDHFNDNYETLYKIYQSTKFCDECNVELNIEGDGRTRKCLDHEHQSGYFRNILCNSCNVRRG